MTASGQLAQIDSQKRTTLALTDLNEDGACGTVTELAYSPSGNVTAVGFADGWLRYRLCLVVFLPTFCRLFDVSKAGKIRLVINKRLKAG
jgi:hypothetical protein